MIDLICSAGLLVVRYIAVAAVCAIAFDLCRALTPKDHP